MLQTPPLDLRQVEIIKGSSSTLYGGGAIAGLVNLVTKTPTEKRDFQIQLNGTTAKGLDVNTFFGQRFGKVGTTVFASYNRNWAYDPSHVGFTAIPQFDRFTVNPTLFLYFTESTNLNIGLESMVENRLGGDMEYIRHGYSEGHPYFERNKSQRYSSRISFKHRFNDQSSLNVKNSATLYKRDITILHIILMETSGQHSVKSHTLIREKSLNGLSVVMYGPNGSTKRESQTILTETIHSTPMAYL